MKGSPPTCGSPPGTTSASGTPASAGGPSARPAAAPKVIGRLPGETSCLTLAWAVLDRASRGWRGLAMTSDGPRLLQDLRRSLPGPPRQLRPRTVTATRDDDRSGNASAIA